MYKLTFVWAADYSGTHANLPEPLDRMEANVTRDERWVEVMIPFEIFVHIPAKFLHSNRKKSDVRWTIVANYNCLAALAFTIGKGISAKNHMPAIETVFSIVHEPNVFVHNITI